MADVFLFFFSSRRRHTRLQGDWSSDVCSSDLGAAGDRLTETGIAVGTPAYMSPEQATAERDLDARSDIYSLGCVLYEMLAGEPPYTGPSAQAVLAKCFSEPIPHIRTVRESVPEAIEEAVSKALAKTPADRFATAAQFTAALQAWSVGAPSGARRRARRLLVRSEEHTSELQSPCNLVCRLLLEKK